MTKPTQYQLQLLKQQYNIFEDIWEKDENDIEFVYARNLQKTFDYTNWANFLRVINKAKISCKNNEIDPANHFFDVPKTINLATGAVKEMDDIKLTRYACYLIAQNGDPRKSKISFAQHYFAVQTRKFEKIVERMDNMERLESRKKLKESEKKFNRIAYERGVQSADFGILKSKGDNAFFGGNDTQAMKIKLNVPDNRPLQDFTSQPVVLGKALANAITTENIVQKDTSGLQDITEVHIISNTNVRDALCKSGIVPENMPPEPDIKKIEKEIKQDNKKLTLHQNKK